MKKGIYLLISACILFAISSCSRGSGCPSETAAGNLTKNGQLTTKPGKSNLFDKKMQKKMRNR